MGPSLEFPYMFVMTSKRPSHGHGERERERKEKVDRGARKGMTYIRGLHVISEMAREV